MERYIFTISGMFGYGDIELADVLNHLAIASGKALTIKVNSIGGDVATGTSIRNAIDQYAETYDVGVNFEIIGWAQSTASYLTTIPRGKVIVNPDSLYMIHNPRADAFGDYVEVENRLSWLLPVTESFRTAYATKSGKPVEEIKDALDKETFYMGQEIVDAGFADEMRQVNTNGLTACGNRADLVAKAKAEFDKLRAVAISGNVKKMAAMGGRLENNSAGDAQKDEAEMSDKTKPAAPDENAVAVAKAEARALAFSEAIAKLPTMVDSLKKAFSEGEDEAFFKGMVAHADAVAADAKAKEEAEKHNGAKADGVGELGTGETAPKSELLGVNATKKVQVG